MHSHRAPSPGRNATTKAAVTLTTVAALACFALAGCGPKEEPEASPAATAPATAAAPGQTPPAGAAPPDHGKISSGADPQKAPPYPGMYGKPAGAQ